MGNRLLILNRYNNWISIIMRGYFRLVAADITLLKTLFSQLLLWGLLPSILTAADIRSTRTVNSQVVIADSVYTWTYEMVMRNCCNNSQTYTSQISNRCNRVVRYFVFDYIKCCWIVLVDVADDVYSRKIRTLLIWFFVQVVIHWCFFGRLE